MSQDFGEPWIFVLSSTRTRPLGPMTRVAAHVRRRPSLLLFTWKPRQVPQIHEVPGPRAPGPDFGHLKVHDKLHCPFCFYPKPLEIGPWA